MLAERTELTKLVKASTIFFLCWLCGFVISYVWVNSGWRMPGSFRILENVMWFYPQQVLPHGLETIGDNNNEVLSSPAAMTMSVTSWLLVGFSFGWFTRRLQLYFTIPLAILAIYVGLFAANAFLYIFGVQVPLDGP